LIAVLECVRAGLSKAGALDDFLRLDLPAEIREAFTTGEQQQGVKRGRLAMQRLRTFLSRFGLAEAPSFLSPEEVLHVLAKALPLPARSLLFATGQRTRSCATPGCRGDRHTEMHGAAVLGNLPPAHVNVIETLTHLYGERDEQRCARCGCAATQEHRFDTLPAVLCVTLNLEGSPGLKSLLSLSGGELLGASYQPIGFVLYTPAHFQSVIELDAEWVLADKGSRYRQPPFPTGAGGEAYVPAQGAVRFASGCDAGYPYVVRVAVFAKTDDLMARLDDI
jgi:hypothetical protein